MEEADIVDSLFNSNIFISVKLLIEFEFNITLFFSFNQVFNLLVFNLLVESYDKSKLLIYYIYYAPSISNLLNIFFICL